MRPRFMGGALFMGADLPGSSRSPEKSVREGARAHKGRAHTMHHSYIECSAQKSVLIKWYRGLRQQPRKNARKSAQNARNPPPGPTPEHPRPTRSVECMRAPFMGGALFMGADLPGPSRSPKKSVRDGARAPKSSSARAGAR